MSSDLNSGFEKLVRNKIEDYSVPVDPGSWDAIEKSLMRRKRLKYLYVATGAVAAAVILLMIMLNLPDDENRQNDVNRQTAEETASPQQQTPAPTPTPENQSRQTPENQSKQEQPVSSSVYNAITNITAVAQAVEKPETYPENPPVQVKEKLHIERQTVPVASIDLFVPGKLQIPHDMRPPVALSEKSVPSKRNDNISDIKNRAARRNMTELNNKKWSVSMSFCAGNYQSPSNMNNKNSDLIMSVPLLTSSNSVDYVRNKYRDGIMVPDNAGSQHGLPLSAKFIVRKDIDSRWAIESGLSYTYLSTKYKWNKNTVSQQLHYLGIPLNVVCYIVAKPSWNIYASAGGMIEKGVYSRINRSDNFAAKAKMNGLQWSVNGAAGITYKLHKSVGMFFEPQLGYFFDNGHPESIRSEWPVSFSIGVGLRFSL
jgi:hypothetical protein